jgi:hypothetical protein
MVVFNPDNEESLTVAETIVPALKVTCSFEADQYLADYVAFAMIERVKILFNL